MANKLEIEIGMLMEIVNDDNDVVFHARVIDYDGEAVTLENSAGGRVPPVEYNASYKLRGHLSDDRRVVYRGTVCGSSSAIWKMDRLSNWFTWDKREFFRQSIAVDGVLTRVKRAEDGPDAPMFDEDEYNCQLIDISGGGAMVSCDAFFEVGDQLRVSNVEIIPGTQPFTFQCSVRRVQQTPYSNMYGCQFLRMRPNEQDRLVSAIFVLQREEAKRLRGRK